MIKYFQTYLMICNFNGLVFIYHKLDQIYQKDNNCVVTNPEKKERTPKEIFSDPKLIM